MSLLQTSSKPQLSCLECNEPSKLPSTDPHGCAPSRRSGGGSRSGGCRLCRCAGPPSPPPASTGHPPPCQYPHTRVTAAGLASLNYSALLFFWIFITTTHFINMRNNKQLYKTSAHKYIWWKLKNKKTVTHIAAKKQISPVHSLHKQSAIRNHNRIFPFTELL